MTAEAGGGSVGGGAGGGEESLTYEELLETLEELTRRMADGAIGIEEVVELYERAGRLHVMAAQRLARVQARIEALAAEGAPDVGAGASEDGGEAG